MPLTLQEATEAPRGYEVNVREEQKKCVQGALPLAAINLVLSRHVEAVYNLGLRVSEPSACADILAAQSQAQPPDGMTPIPGRMDRRLVCHRRFRAWIRISKVRSGRRCIFPSVQISLKEPMPVVPIPLLPGDADVALDVQQVFTTIYDLLGYDLALDYTQLPEIPLPKDDGAWAEALLRTARLR